MVYILLTEGIVWFYFPFLLSFLSSPCSNIWIMLQNCKAFRYFFSCLCIDLDSLSSFLFEPLIDWIMFWMSQGNIWNKDITRVQCNPSDWLCVQGEKNCKSPKCSWCMESDWAADEDYSWILLSGTRNFLFLSVPQVCNILTPCFKHIMLRFLILKPQAVMFWFFMIWSLYMFFL